MSSSNSDRISRRHSMIKQPSSQFNHYLQKTVFASITLPTTDGNQVWFTVWLMHPGLTWWLIALVEYSEETVATYEGLMRPLNFQFLQKKSLRIFQLVTHSKELVISSSSASPDSVASSPAGETDPPPVAVPPPLRRSTRRV